MKNRIISFLLATVMLIAFALPASAQGLVNITDYGENAGPEAPQEVGEPIATPTSPADESVSVGEATPGGTTAEAGSEAPTETEQAPALGQSGDNAEAELIAAMDEWLDGHRLVVNPRLRAAPGDTGSITHSTISIRPYDVTVPGVGRAYGSVVWKMKVKGEDAFCLEIWKLAGGMYTAGDATSGNGDTAQYIANYMASGKSNTEYVAAQVLVWESLYGDIGIFDQSIAGTNYESAYNDLKDASADVADLTYWTSSTGGQDIVTYASGQEPEEPGDPPDDPPDEEEEGNPDTHTEVTTESSTRTEIRSSTEYEYADGIGQITVAKRDQDGNSLDGAIFNIVVEFADGSRGGDSAFEIYNGSRLFTWTHPENDYQPARVTVTEVRPPDGYADVIIRVNPENRIDTGFPPI